MTTSAAARRRVVFERRDPVEHLPFTLDVFDASDNFTRCWAASPT
jgi:hypothetical protein